MDTVNKVLLVFALTVLSGCAPQYHAIDIDGIRAATRQYVYERTGYRGGGGGGGAAYPQQAPASSAYQFLEGGSRATGQNTPYLVDRKTGRYLGNLNANSYDPNSVNNRYGVHGNSYNYNSINNHYGPYGNPYSNSSVTNPYATNAPAIIAPR